LIRSRPRRLRVSAWHVRTIGRAAEPQRPSGQSTGQREARRESATLSRQSCSFERFFQRPTVTWSGEPEIGSRSLGIPSDMADAFSADRRKARQGREFRRQTGAISIGYVGLSTDGWFSGLEMLLQIRRNSYSCQWRVFATPKLHFPASIVALRDVAPRSTRLSTLRTRL
jgi:hypothetical protein